MGVDGLAEYIRANFPSAYKKVHISTFTNEKIMWDISSYMYAHIYTFGKDKWLIPFVRLFFLFKEYNIHFFPIFDGTPPPEKEETRVSRTEQRTKIEERIMNLSISLKKYQETGEVEDILLEEWNKVKPQRLMHQSKGGKDEKIDQSLIEKQISTLERQTQAPEKEDIDQLKELLTQFGIPYLDAPEEAETLCCYFVNQGKAITVLSKDSDCISYGVKLHMSEFDYKTGMCTVLNRDELLKGLEFDNSKELLEFCILIGCDYNRGTRIKGLGPKISHKLIKEFGDIDKAKTKDKRLNVDDYATKLRLKRCREIFTTVYPQYTFICSWDPNINLEKLITYLKDHGLYSDEKKIRDLWKKPEIIFEDDLEIS